MQTQTDSIDLEDPAQSGVFLVTDEDLQTVSQATHAPSTCVRHVDLTSCGDRHSAVAALDRALGAPAGGNARWDALGERLLDLSWLPAQGYVLMLGGAHELHEASPHDFDLLLDVLDEAAAGWAHARIPFFCFVAFPGQHASEGTDEMEDFHLRGEYVELNQLLKLTGICDSGGAGKALVAAGAVRVDGHTELRKTCKIRAGQRVEVDGRHIRVLADKN
jgi:ribosome-associated protein YbcJ (S4-like RNA binding protein)